MHEKVAATTTRARRFMEFTTLRGYLDAVVHFFPLNTMREAQHTGENTGVIKQLAVALFVPIVTGVFTALVTGYVAQAVLTERLSQLQQTTDKTLDRMSTMIERLSSRIDRVDEKTQSWIIQHERDSRGK